MLPKRNSRLSTPFVREGGKTGVLREATWNEALERVAAGFARAIEKGRATGQSPFGLFSCSKTTNEMNYTAQKFTRAVMGSNNIDSCNRT